jgi:hypothetical protein
MSGDTLYHAGVCCPANACPVAELHQTIEKVSTDFLSPATRADRDRCLLASLIGVALSIGNLKPDVSLGPVVINLAKHI